MNIRDKILELIDKEKLLNIWIYGGIDMTEEELVIELFNEDSNLFFEFSNSKFLRLEARKNFCEIELELIKELKYKKEDYSRYFKFDIENYLLPAGRDAEYSLEAIGIIDALEEENCIVGKAVQMHFAAKNGCRKKDLFFEPRRFYNLHMGDLEYKNEWLHDIYLWSGKKQLNESWITKSSDETQNEIIKMPI